MLSTRLGRLMQFLFACGILVTAFMMLRLHRVEAADLGPTVDPERATQTYVERIDATEMLLQTEQLEISGQ
jgi:hypothetical protein